MENVRAKAALGTAGMSAGLWIGAMSRSAMYRRREPAYKPPVTGTLTTDEAGSLEIAGRDDALTFARYRRNGLVRAMLVESYQNGRLKGIEVGEEFAGQDADPIMLFNRFGYDTIADLTDAPTEIGEADLLVPFDGTSTQVAMGGNYPKHAAETSIRKNFLFPKLNSPGHFLEPVASHGVLLDHEIELGFVALASLTADEPVKHMGVVLAADYTDRATLMRRLDIRDVSSGRGFCEAKSRPGYMPIGNLFVVPRDLNNFYRALTLRLYVDGKLHQLANPREMLWTPSHMVRQVLQQAGRCWTCSGRQVRLPVAQGRLTERTIILSGTSDGVLFRPPSARQLALGLMEAPFGRLKEMQARLVEPAIREAAEQRRYLQPGMEVVMRSNTLGKICNRIV